MEDIMAPWEDFDLSNLQGLQRRDSPPSQHGYRHHLRDQPGEAASPRASSPAGSFRPQSRRKRRRRDAGDGEWSDDGGEGDDRDDLGSQGDATVATKKRRKGGAGGDGEMNPLRTFCSRVDQTVFFQYLKRWAIRQREQPGRHCALHWHEKLPGTISSAYEGAANGLEAALKYVTLYRWQIHDKMSVAQKVLDIYNEEVDEETKEQHPFDILDACHCVDSCGNRHEVILNKYLDTLEGELDTLIRGGLYFRAVDTPPDEQPFLDRGASKILKDLGKSINDTIGLIRSLQKQ